MPQMTVTEEEAAVVLAFRAVKAARNAAVDAQRTVELSKGDATVKQQLAEKALADFKRKFGFGS